MARPVSLIEIKLQALQRANLENSPLINSPELVSMINSSAAEIYEVIINSDETYFLRDPLDIITSNGTKTYPLPDDFYRELGIDININGIKINARRFMFSERNLYQSPSIWSEGSPVAYDIIGNNIRVYPTPTGNYTMTLWYYPAPGALSDDQDTFDYIAGYEEYVVADVAVKCRRKEGLDASDLERDRDAQKVRVRTMAGGRQLGMPFRVNRERYYREAGTIWRPRWM